MINNNIHKKIAEILRKIGTEKCIEKAEILESESPRVNSIHLRDLTLSSSNLIDIVNCLKEEKNHHLRSISISYNHLIGDSSAIFLLKNLPESICEIGLVNCGISDVGGIEILQWMRNSTNLRMICMEQNNFSKKLKIEFNKFSVSNPQILVVY